MVSNASDDLPDPLSPVITVRVLRGISTEMFLRLCWRAPRTVILLMAMESDNLSLKPAEHLPGTQIQPHRRVQGGQRATLLSYLSCHSLIGSIPAKLGVVGRFRRKLTCSARLRDITRGQ